MNIAAGRAGDDIGKRAAAIDPNMPTAIGIRRGHRAINH
jgi:hypothetical protein